MEKYDIIQIDDAPYGLQDMEREAKRAGLSYMSGSNLYDLGQILRKNDAGVWVIDGVFPRRKGERAQKSGDLAVREIQKVRKDAKIILYSSTPEDFSELAGLGVRLENKDEISPEKLVEDIKILLGKF